MNDEIILKKFAERLSELVREHDTNINDLANKIGIKSKSTIYRYMHGGMAPKLTTIKYLAEIYNVNPIWLMGYDVPKNSIPIKKIDKILENVKCSDLQENDTKDIIRGKKISTLRTQIVHFDFSKDKHLPNIEKVIKLMEIFECLICDFIFEIINVDEEVRSSLLKQQENLCLSHRL